MTRNIYMDNAATTKVSDEVLKAMMPYFQEDYGNASSIYTLGGRARVAVDQARETIASRIGASAKELFFTSGGSEADNWAIKGIAEANKEKGKHIISTTIEHHAVLHTLEHLAKEGFEVTYLPVDEYGMVSVEDLEKAIRKDTILITIMFANNEIGTIQPIKEIGEIAKKHGIIFHTDAVQAIGAVDINVKDLNIDALSMSGHKIHAQKGIGALYIRQGLRFPNLIDGGAQERRRRAGTENVPAIVGFAKAFEIAIDGMEARNKRLIELRTRLQKGLLERIPETRLNGHPEKRLPNNTNVCFRYIEGESILLMLDMEGIQASSGSACTSGSLDPSHVLLAIGLPHGIAHGSVRLTISEETTEEDVDYVIEKLEYIVDRLRKMSPLYNRSK